MVFLYREKEPPYGMSITEMLVRDSLLGCSLAKTGASSLPTNVCVYRSGCLDSSIILIILIIYIIYIVYI